MVCRHCGHHFRIGSAERFRMLFDGAAFETVEPPKTPVDPLRFRDRKRYSERLREGQAALGAGSDAVAVARGRIGDVPAVVAAFDFAFMGGSMGVAAGEALVAASRIAVERQAALIVIPSSGGARMQEGILSLMQMPRTIIAADLVKEAGLPYLVVLTDRRPAASPPRLRRSATSPSPSQGRSSVLPAPVIEETIREKLPEGFQRAEYLLEHGMVDMVVPRGELTATIARILKLLRQPNPEPAVLPGEPGVSGAPSAAEAVLTRLSRLHPKKIDLSLGRIERLLAALGDPQTGWRRPSMSPHQRQGPTVATLARLPRSGGTPPSRLYLAASGAVQRAHPARRPADRRCDAGRDPRRGRAGQCRREITFSRSPPPLRSRLFARAGRFRAARGGLGGRLDTTNVVRHPAVTAITPVSLDIRRFSGRPWPPSPARRPASSRPVLRGDRPQSMRPRR